MSILSQQNIDLIKKVFFLAMMDGYVNEDTKKHKIIKLPGSRLITFEHYEDNQQFVVNDLYFVTNLSNYSHGVTSISCDGQPVWMMSYEGIYRKCDIPLLRKALHHAYSKKLFFGGRGAGTHPLGNHHVYYNDVTKGNFESFSGGERIVNELTGTRVGWHEYRGLLMV